MLGPNHILDAPASNYKSKIRKTSFLFFELSLLGYYLFIAISIGNMIWDFPPFRQESFVATCLWFLLGLIVNAALFLGYASLAAIPLSCHVLLFYNWYKTSLRYDESFEKLGLRRFHRRFLNTTTSPFFLFFILTAVCILIASILFLSVERINPSLFYTSIAAASLVYALLSACYGFIIRKAVNGVLD